jgi:hypothetical protein
MTSVTKRDAVNAAMSVATDVAEGRLSPTDLETTAVMELRQLVGEVVGPGDPVWDLQVQIARGVLALDGVPADELSEWLAVARQRAGEPLSQPDSDRVEPEPISSASEALTPECVGAQPDADDEPKAQQPAVAAVAAIPKHCSDGYDPLAHWQPGSTRRN